MFLKACEDLSSKKSETLEKSVLWLTVWRGHPENFPLGITCGPFPSSECVRGGSAKVQCDLMEEEGRQRSQGALVSAKCTSESLRGEPDSLTSTSGMCSPESWA